MNKKFVSEAEMCKKDPWLPEALMLVVYFQEASVQKMVDIMRIEPSHAAKLIELLKEYGFVEKTKDGDLKVVISQKKYCQDYLCSMSVLEGLFSGKKLTITDDLGSEWEKEQELHEQDSLLPEVLMFAANKGQISAMMIRRRYGIGYPRATKIIDIMESYGYVCPANGPNPRNVLITKEECARLSGFTVEQQDEMHKEPTAEELQRKKELFESLKLDKLQLLDEKGKTLNNNKCKKVKELLAQQFQGFGLICIEPTEAKTMFEQKKYKMICKTFLSPAGEDVQKYFDENKIESAILLYDPTAYDSIQIIADYFPKINGTLLLAITIPIVERKLSKVYILY